jgi:hypothetical protein
MFSKFSHAAPNIPERLFKIVAGAAGPTTNGRYFHWDELQYRTPPGDLTVEDWWLGLKMHRQSGRRPAPLRDTAGNNFFFTVPDLVADLLHQIDRGSGTIVQKQDGL